jgi:hypothetical protein
MHSLFLHLGFLDVVTLILPVETLLLQHVKGRLSEMTLPRAETADIEMSEM